MEPTTPEQQLEQFQSARAERRTEVEQRPTEQQESEYETTSRVTEEAIRKEAPSFEASSHSPRSVDESLPPDESQTVKSWVDAAFNEGPYTAIKKIKDADPAMLDAFHAALTGRFHDQLVSDKKLEEVR